MRLNIVFDTLFLYWRLCQLKWLAYSVQTPNGAQLEKMLELLEQTHAKSGFLPSTLSPGWYRELALSNSRHAHTLCCASKLDAYTNDFIYDLMQDALRMSNIPLLERLSNRLRATECPLEFWHFLENSDSFVQLRVLIKLLQLEELTGNTRQLVITMLSKFNPYLLMYDFAAWYTALSRAWKFSPPVHWWHALYTSNLYQPQMRSLHSLVTSYKGLTITSVFPIKNAAYSEEHLMHHRSAILSQDPWAVVRSAFYGDTQMWPPRPVHNQHALAMYVDAYAILMQYYPQTNRTDFQSLVPDYIRSAKPRMEIMLFLGMPSGPDAAQAFSSWLADNNGELISATTTETFSLDNLL